MTSFLPARRRAEEFARLVDRPATATDGGRDADLLTLVADLREVEAPAPRADFVADLRERLLAEADTVLLPRDIAAEDRLRLPADGAISRPNRRLATAAGAIAMVGATASMAVVAQAALPGDTLYPIKRAIEDAQAGISTSEASKGLTMLGNASGRLDEASLLASRGGSAELPRIEGALETFTAQTQSAATLLLDDYASRGETAPLEELRSFVGQSLGRIESLGSLLPPEANPTLLAVAQHLTALDAQALDACPACGGGAAEIPQVLLLAAGQVADGVDGALPLPEIDDLPLASEQEQTPAIELPQIDEPLDEGATGTTGLPEAAPVAPPQAAPDSASTAPQPGTRLKRRVDRTLDDLAKGLVGDDEGNEGLLTGLTGGVTDTLTGTIVGLTDGLGGLLGGTATNDDD